MKELRIFSLIAVIIMGMLFTLSCNSCQSKKQAVTAETYEKISPDFNADSAYSFVEKQVAFGPRVPKTSAHEKCGDYLVAKLDEFGAQVVEQKANITHYDGQNI